MGDVIAELAAFKALAETGALRTAAARVGISTAQFASAIRRLERHLGGAVIDRRDDALSITSFGRALIDRTEDEFEALRRALIACEEPIKSPGGRLRIHANAELAEMLVSDVIVGFANDHPNIEVEFAVEDRADIVLRPDFDLAIRAEYRAAHGIASQRIWPSRHRWVTAAAPKLLDALPAINAPADLASAPAIVFKGGIETKVWSFARNGTSLLVTPMARLTVTRMAMALSAAIAGIGFIHACDAFLQREIEPGRLVEVLQEWSVPIPDVSAYYFDRPQLPQTIHAFLGYAGDKLSRPTKASSRRPAP